MFQYGLLWGPEVNRTESGYRLPYRYDKGAYINRSVPPQITLNPNTPTAAAPKR